MQMHLDTVKKRFEQDQFARALGIRLDELTETSVQMHMASSEAMSNWFGKLHGAAIYSLADAAFSVLANNQNNLSVALDCSISYHASPAMGAKLVVKGECCATSARTGGYLFRVYQYTDGGPELIATMKAVSFRTGKPIDCSSVS